MSAQLPLRNWTVRYLTPDGRRGEYLGPDNIRTAAEAMLLAGKDLGAGYTITSAYEGGFAKRMRLKREQEQA